MLVCIASLENADRISLAAVSSGLAVLVMFKIASRVQPSSVAAIT